MVCQGGSDICFAPSSFEFNFWGCPSSSPDAPVGLPLSVPYSCQSWSPQHSFFPFRVKARFSRYWGEDQGCLWAARNQWTGKINQLNTTWSSPGLNHVYVMCAVQVTAINFMQGPGRLLRPVGHIGPGGKYYVFRVSRPTLLKGADPKYF